MWVLPGAHLGWRPVPPSPRRGAVPRPGCRLRSEDSGCCAALARLCPHPLTPCLGGGDRRRAGRGRRAATQVYSSTRAARRGEQRRSSGWRRQRRRCHCRCHLRATPGNPVRPGPPRSTHLSISGAPRRSSSLRGLTVGCSFRTRSLIVGCSFRTRSRRPSVKPGKFLAQALQAHLLPLLLQLGGGQRPGLRFTWLQCNWVQRGSAVASAGDQVPRGSWLRSSTSEEN